MPFKVCSRNGAASAPAYSGANVDFISYYPSLNCPAMVSALEKVHVGQFHDSVASLVLITIFSLLV